jgi:hypothetical protein
VDKASEKQRDERVKGVNDFLNSLTTLDDSLLTAFTKVVNALNAGDWQTVRDVCDDNVVLTTVDNPATYRNKGRVIAYIKTKIAKDQPILATITVKPDSTTGIVNGIAWWEDRDNNVPTTRKISYQFIFNWHDAEQKWYLLNLWGTPD